VRLRSMNIDPDDAIFLRDPFFRRPAEALEAFVHHNVLESDLCQQCDELCLRQSAGDSTGPQIDVASDGLG
jgi:hypothetical protein